MTARFRISIAVGSQDRVPPRKHLGGIGEIKSALAKGDLPFHGIERDLHY
jgi:hypothetical protein